MWQCFTKKSCGLTSISNTVRTSGMRRDGARYYIRSTLVCPIIVKITYPVFNRFKILSIRGAGTVRVQLESQLYLNGHTTFGVSFNFERKCAKIWGVEGLQRMESHLVCGVQRCTHLRTCEIIYNNTTKPKKMIQYSCMNSSHQKSENFTLRNFETNSACQRIHPLQIYG